MVRMNKREQITHLLQESKEEKPRAFPMKEIGSSTAQGDITKKCASLRSFTKRQLMMSVGTVMVSEFGCHFFTAESEARKAVHVLSHPHGKIHPRKGNASSPLSAPYLHKGSKPPPPLIMLDPGHGGKDPGAIGISGTYEKHIAHAAALELRRQLLATGHYHVVMTRTSDKFIPLDGRVSLAHKHKAALFISMHADALHNSNVSGASVYTLSSRASDKQSASLAATENSADRFGGVKVQAASPEVQAILASLVKEETKRSSSFMANSVVSAFRPRIGLLQNPYRHAGFVVLKSADIPSVLVEMGFMSNHRDEQALRQSAHRARVAASMVMAVNHYFAAAHGMNGLNRNLTG